MSSVRFGRASEHETANEDMQKRKKKKTVLGVAEYPSLVDGLSFFVCFFGMFDNL